MKTSAQSREVSHRTVGMTNLPPQIRAAIMVGEAMQGSVDAEAAERPVRHCTLAQETSAYDYRSLLSPETRARLEAQSDGS